MRVLLKRPGSAVMKSHTVEVPRPQFLITGDAILSVTTPDGTVIITMTVQESEELSRRLQRRIR